MKQIIFSTLIFMAATSIKAQSNDYSDNKSGGFKKENVFVGGSISLGFGSGSFGVGANPEIGYSVAQWLDAGIAANINYNSQRLYNYGSSGYYNAGKASIFNYGAGVFARVYPLPFLFIQAQPEINWISISQKDNYGNKIKQTVNAPSLIGALGYSQRVITQGSYFFMIGLDLINDKNSPYNDGYGHAMPIVRGGFDIYLRPSGKQKRSAPEL
ncbi:MAG: hypothetical protein JST21_15350 [Bacteroidetes bacterium]|nr:hypothetical protein [Bacteroidota bacterium]